MSVYKKLRKWRDKIADVHINDIPDFLAKKGFTRLAVDYGSGWFKVGNQEEGVVVKQSYPNQETPKEARSPYTGLAYVLSEEVEATQECTISSSHPTLLRNGDT